jgi:hypothetical protein
MGMCYSAPVFVRPNGLKWDEFVKTAVFMKFKTAVLQNQPTPSPKQKSQSEDRPLAGFFLRYPQCRYTIGHENIQSGLH